ncbi:MAG: glycosyltransferase family 39 protein [Chloroflexi bacterium]|nr:glycosyltransferase family 39 protein [Chloroflexota bacterium]
MLGLLALFALLAPFVNTRIYASDEIEYFAYTHSLLFDQDLDFSNEYLHFYNIDRNKFAAIYTDLYAKREPLTGLPINVAPIGTGLLWLPTYALTHLALLGAHAVGIGTQVAADGYSQPYITAICLTSYLLGCLGLLLCYSLARRYFGGRVAAACVVLMWLATPLIFYTVIAPPWSHATSLFTVTLFIWYWSKTRREEGRRLREWVILGGMGGLMMLVREQDALFLTIVGVEALWGVGGRGRERGGKLAAWLRWAGGLAVMGITGAIVFIPQLISYRVITGRFGPSRVVTGKFTLTTPNALSVLFSPEHGLLAWTPVLVLALGGLILLWRKDRLMGSALVIAFLLQVYIAGSFLTWQSAGSFGQRRFINSTAIFVLGACALTCWALEKGVSKWVVGAVGAFFIAWNGGLLMQYALWCSQQRQGLDWATLVSGQLQMAGKAVSLARDYIMERSSFYRRSRGC